jgi:hypothetical protein
MAMAFLAKTPRESSNLQEDREFGLKSLDV